MALLFIGVTALICLVNFIAKDKESSEKENRMLTQKPAVTWSGIESGRFMSQYESYKSDQFAGRICGCRLRPPWIFYPETESNGVFKGKDHYLLEEIKAPGEQTEKNLEAIRAFAGRYPEISFYMALSPNAANILSDKLPFLAVTKDQGKQFQKIRESLGSDVTWVDLQKALESHKEEEIYYRTDHHWTSLGHTMDMRRWRRPWSLIHPRRPG